MDISTRLRQNGHYPGYCISCGFKNSTGAYVCRSKPRCVNKASRIMNNLDNDDGMTLASIFGD